MAMTAPTPIAVTPWTNRLAASFRSLSLDASIVNLQNRAGFLMPLRIDQPAKAKPTAISASAAPGSRDFPIAKCRS